MQEGPQGDSAFRSPREPPLLSRAPPKGCSPHPVTLPGLPGSTRGFRTFLALAPTTAVIAESLHMLIVLLKVTLFFLRLLIRLQLSNIVSQFQEKAE